MGCLLSCLKKAGKASGPTSNGKETEMSTKSSKSLSISRAMTAPTIEVKNGLEVSVSQEKSILASFLS